MGMAVMSGARASPQKPSPRFSAPSRFPACNLAASYSIFSSAEQFHLLSCLTGRGFWVTGACWGHLRLLAMPCVAAAPQCLLCWAKGLWQSGEEGAEQGDVGEDAPAMRK